MKSLTIPEIVRPMPIEEAVKELGKMGLTENNEEGTPRITWEEAKKITRQMVDKARKRQTQPEVQEYAEAIGIERSMRKATWQYAEWSAAVEVRLLSAKCVKVKMDDKQADGEVLRKRATVGGKAKTSMRKQRAELCRGTGLERKCGRSVHKRPTGHDC